MNERIRELAEQAGAEFFEDKGIQILPNGVWKATKFENHKHLDLEKFAQLIVQECADSALAKGRASPDTDFRTGSYVISEYLLSRYGVE